MDTTIKKSTAVFLDRDGVINEERQYVHLIDDFVLLPGVLEGLTILRDAGYKLVVVTNQAGIARGYYDQNAMYKLHEHLKKLLSIHRITLDGIYHCPHHPNGLVPDFSIDCICRKPSPGMLIKAARELELDLASSVLVGDKLSDIEAGKRAGLKHQVIVESGHAVDVATRECSSYVASDLLQAAKWLVGQNADCMLD